MCSQKKPVRTLITLLFGLFGLLNPVLAQTIQLQNGQNT